MTVFPFFDLRRRRLSGPTSVANAGTLTRIENWRAGMDLQLVGKRALVTGATRGIGRAIADGLVSEGCSVSICARDAAAVSAWVAAHPGCHGEPVNVADPEALSLWIERS